MDQEHDRDRSPDFEEIQSFLKRSEPGSRMGQSVRTRERGTSRCYSSCIVKSRLFDIPMNFKVQAHCVLNGPGAPKSPLIAERALAVQGLFLSVNDRRASLTVGRKTVRLLMDRKGYPLLHVAGVPNHLRTPEGARHLAYEAMRKQRKEASRVRRWGKARAPAIGIIRDRVQNVRNDQDDHEEGNADEGVSSPSSIKEEPVYAAAVIDGLGRLLDL